MKRRMHMYCDVFLSRLNLIGCVGGQRRCLRASIFSPLVLYIQQPRQCNDSRGYPVLFSVQPYGICCPWIGLCR